MASFLSAQTLRGVAGTVAGLGAAACVALGSAGGAFAAQHAVAQSTIASTQHAPARSPLGLRARSWVDPRFARALKTDTIPLIYLTVRANRTVVAYPQNMTTLPAAPLETIASLNQPGALAVDGRGNLYVIDNENGTNVIKVFAPGKTTPSRVLTAAPPGQSYELFVDSRGNVYFTTFNSGGVSVILKGARSPSYTLTDPSIGEGLDVVVDASGNVFLSYFPSNGGAPAVGAFPAFTTLGPASLGFNFFHQLNIDVALNSPTPLDIGIDKHGDLLVADSLNTVSVYPSDSQTAAVAFPIIPAGTFTVLRLTGPNNRHLFVPTLGSNVFDEYAYPSGKHEAHFDLGTTVMGGNASIGGIALSPAPPLGTW